MIVPPKDVPRRPGPVMLYASRSHDGGWGKWWMMQQVAAQAAARGLKVLYVSYDRERAEKVYSNSLDVLDSPRYNAAWRTQTLPGTLSFD